MRNLRTETTRQRRKATLNGSNTWCAAGKQTGSIPGAAALKACSALPPGGDHGYGQSDTAPLTTKTKGFLIATDTLDTAVHALAERVSEQATMPDVVIGELIIGVRVLADPDSNPSESDAYGPADMDAFQDGE